MRPISSTPVKRVAVEISVRVGPHIRSDIFKMESIKVANRC